MTMNKITNETEMPIGETLDEARVIVVDRAVKRVELLFSDGTNIEFSIHSYNELQALITAPPELKEYWVVKGRIKNISASVMVRFDNESDANTYVEEVWLKLHPTEDALPSPVKMRRDLGLMLTREKLAPEEVQDVANDDDIPF